MDRFHHYLEQHPKESLADIAYTANTGRSHFDYRFAIVAKTTEEALEEWKNHKFYRAKVSANPPKIDLPQELELSARLHLLAQLYVAGAAVDWKEFDASYQRKKVVLPTYPFQRKRYWYQPLDLDQMASVEPPTPRFYR